MTYAGEVDVEGGEFILEMDTFILRDREISFSGSGVDEDSSFSVEGVAKLTEDGFYEAPQLSVNYKNYTGEHNVNIRINVEETPGKRKCKVSGFWIENGIEWELKGDLKAKPK